MSYKGIVKHQYYIRKQDPLKQGLKLSEVYRTLRPGGYIRKQDPLKQGLKQVHIAESPPDETIRKQDPLKQGLKQ